MGDSLFGGGTSKINSLVNSNQSTNTNTNNTANTSQNQTQSGTQLPPDFQLPFMRDAFGTASNYLANSPTFQGQQYNPLSQNTYDAQRALVRFDSGNSGFGNNLMAAGGGVVQPGLSGALGAASQAANYASQDPTQANINSAGLYANNPYTQGLIHAAQTPIERQLNEVSVPNLNIGAAGSGNSDSSRAGMTEAILRRSAGEDEANVASNILGNQYNNGLNLAESARVANNNTLLGSAGALSGLAGQGGSLVGAGNSLAQGNLRDALSASFIPQQDANSQNQVAYQNFLSGSQYPWQQLANYYNIVGKPVGQQTTGTQSGTGFNSTSGTSSGTSSGTNLTNGTQTQPGPGVLGGLLGIGTGIGSFFAPTGAFGGGASIADRIFGGNGQQGIF